MLSCESTGRVGRLRCLDGSRTDTGMPWLGGMLSCESAGRVGRLRCLDGSRATLGHRRQGSSSGTLPPAYALGSRTPGCQCQTVVWLKGEDTWGGGRIQEGKKRRSHTPIHRPTGQGRIELGARSTEHGTWSMGHGRGGEWGRCRAFQASSQSFHPRSTTPHLCRSQRLLQWRGGYGAARRRVPPSAGSTGPMWVCVGQRGNI